MLLCLAGVLVPDAGEVRRGDRVVSALPEKERSALRRSEFGVLFQYGQLVTELTALDNVALPLLLGGTPRPSAEEVARSWLDRFGVAGLAGARPHEMSGGQAQLVAVARALIETVRDQGTSVVLVTHDARVAAYGDREVEVRDGVVLDDSIPRWDAVHTVGERS